MSEEMANENVTASGNTLTVAQAGDYEITYNLGATAGTEITNANFAIQENGSDITGTTETATIGTTTPTVFNGSIIAPLTAGAEITMTVADPASGNATITVDNARLIVKKLDATTEV